jgi:hypothetical protein
MYCTYKKPGSASEMRCHLHVDQDRKTLHILDSNEEGTYTVTNGIDTFLDDIAKDAGIDNVKEWTVIAYCTDGIPFQWAHPGFRKPDDNLLYEPFLTRSKEYAI